MRTRTRPRGTRTRGPTAAGPSALRPVPRGLYLHPAAPGIHQLLCNPDGPARHRAGRTFKQIPKAQELIAGTSRARSTRPNPMPTATLNVRYAQPCPDWHRGDIGIDRRLPVGQAVAPTPLMPDPVGADAASATSAGSRRPADPMSVTSRPGSQEGSHQRPTQALTKPRLAFEIWA
jgi:hypothetical protein